MNSSSVKNFLIILCGIPFAGKTYLAKKLASDLKGDRVDLDEKFILIPIYFSSIAPIPI